MVKTTKGGKVMNPTDAYRKDLRKKELKRNKKERKKVREVGILKKDPEQLRDQIQKLEMMKAEGALDKARKHKKRQLEDTLNVVLKKRREYEDKMKEKGETPVMFSHLGPPRRLTGAEEDDRAKPPKPEDSVYYHPTLNPTGAPPPGKLPMYKSSIGPRDSLSEASSSAGAGSSSAITELDDATLPVPPPPPLPPSLPNSDDLDAVEASVIPESLPLPPPPPMPPKPQGLDPSLPILPPPPPPPPGPPPKEHLALRPPPPPGLNQLAQPPPPGTGGANVENNRSVGPDGFTSKDQIQVPTMLPPPPPPSESNAKIHLDNKDIQQMVPPPPPPPRQPASVPVLGVLPTLQPDILPPGISRLPPPPPMPDMYPPIPGAALPPGMLPYMPRPPFGPPPMMRPPLPPGPPPFLQADDFRPPTVQKPSYVKSAAPTVVKRPLAQHTPELTSMVPASVRVRRESALTKPKPKSSSSATTIMKQSITPTVVKQGSSTTSSSAPKPPSIDDSYMAFLEDMKELGALDS